MHPVYTFVGALVSLGNKARRAWYVCATRKRVSNKQYGATHSARGDYVSTRYMRIRRQTIVTRKQLLRSTQAPAIDGRTCTGCYWHPVVLPHSSVKTNHAFSDR